tara:strand:+ start:1710 stop:2525 length:816 start_codon:yes stop_codon:yes gene_type:complete
MAIQVPAMIAAARAASMSSRALPSRAQKIAEKVIQRPPRPTPQRPGLMGMLPPPPPPQLTAPAFVAGMGGATMLTQEPEDIGKAAARAGLSIQDTIAKVSQSVQDIAQVPADYFDAIREGYRREMMIQQFTPAQQSLGSLRPVQDMKMRVTDPVSPPQRLPITPDTPPAQPVMLKEPETVQSMLQLNEKGMALAMGAAGMDNEPRFSERPVFSQIFTIDNEIKNLNQSLEIALRNNESMRAREIQDRIESLNSLKQTMMPRDNIDQSLSEL